LSPSPFFHPAGPFLRRQEADARTKTGPKVSPSPVGEAPVLFERWRKTGSTPLRWTSPPDAFPGTGLRRIRAFPGGLAPSNFSAPQVRNRPPRV
jgi:hypothetical protein